MNSKLNWALRSALLATVEEREIFIDKFSSVLEKYTGKDADQSKEISEHILSGLNSLREELSYSAFVESLKPESDVLVEAKISKEDIEKLNQNIEKLNQNLEKIIHQEEGV
ncbi:MAG: hypothetical protein RR393_06295 [Bacteroidales bacterium]